MRQFSTWLRRSSKSSNPRGFDTYRLLACLAISAFLIALDNTCQSKLQPAFPRLFLSCYHGSCLELAASLAPPCDCRPFSRSIFC